MVTTLISPCGILGYGFPAASLEKALEQSPDAIVVDAGSTDAGPHKLGAGTAIVSRMAAKKDLSLLMAGARRLQIPLVIGSRFRRKKAYPVDAGYYQGNCPGDRLEPPPDGDLG